MPHNLGRPTIGELSSRRARHELEESNSIIFDCSGAIDFTEHIHIELSMTPKEGFTHILPLDLMWQINSLKHIGTMVSDYFRKICQKSPHISDRNEDLPEERRWTSVYYKCYKRFKHSHEPWGNDYHYTQLSLTEAISYIVDNGLDIKPIRN